jgi:hypothetical protein
MKIKSSSIAIFAFLLYFMTASMYVVPSGLPQPSDIIIALLLFPWAFFYMSRIPYSTRPFLMYLLLFVYWTAIVNLFNAIHISSTGTLQPIAWYFFNFLFIFSMSALTGMLTYEQFFSIIRKLLYLAVFFALILYFILFDYGIRMTGSFNNPNQVGYFGLLIFCNLIIAAWATTHVSMLHKICLAMSAALCLLSFSLTAAGALLIAVIGRLFLYERKGIKIRGVISVLVVVILLSGLLITFFSSEKGKSVLWSWDKRIGVIDNKMQNASEARGYDRIIHYPEYILFGAGEGERWRFKERARTMEFHSSIGTVIFSYGIIGTIIFFLILKSAVWHAPIGVWLVIAAPLSYGLTHHGLRQPMFWMLLFLSMYAIRGKNATTPESTQRTLKML